MLNSRGQKLNLKGLIGRALWPMTARQRRLQLHAQRGSPIGLEPRGPSKGKWPPDFVYFT